MSRLFSIAPHGRFLDVLADRVLDGTLLGDWSREGPFWLSDVTIFLPTKRARLRLAEIFAERRGRATLLPDIRALGADPGETEAPFLPPAEAPPMAPAATPLERRLTLARMVSAFAKRENGFASPPNAAEIFWLADSLGDLIDDLTIEGVPVVALEQIAPEDLAANWQQILKFLRIALDAWPNTLAVRGKIDAAAARNERLLRQAAAATEMYGDRPVIAAGSTGSIPATAALLRAISKLERGALVLPGLDTGLSAAQHAALLEGESAQGHPQYGLAKLLRQIGSGAAEVEELAGEAGRTIIVRTALALPDDTTLWRAQRAQVATPALADLAILAAPNVDLEARAIALAAREAVSEGKSVGIISRDQTLARRIAVELARHGIDVDDPAGTPLYLSEAGRLARQILAVASGNFAIVDVIALLHNGAVSLGRERSEITGLAVSLDRSLRGKTPRPGLDGLLALAPDATRPLLETVGHSLAPLRNSLAAQLEAPALARALRFAMDRLIGAAAKLTGLSEFRVWSDELGAVTDHGPDFAPLGTDSTLAALMAGAKVQDARRRRDDVHIWGELEARLQNVDLMILAGVNEDIWPAPADPGPWLSRSMRIAIGLEPPERRQGQAAHDFEMAVGNAHTVIAYADRLGTSPALPSRLLQRLEAFIGGDAAREMRGRGDRWLDAARALDATGPPVPAEPPKPRPPSSVRPRRLSVTEIEPLVRSPYDIYARHVLQLKRMEPLGAEPDARDRGNRIHKVFERFVTGNHDFEGTDAEGLLRRMAEEEFADLDTISERRDIWLRRFERAASQFLAYERGRDAAIGERFAERRGEWAFPALQNFVLVGKADRIDRRRNGAYEILDFKTGGIPSSKEMTAFEAPQLLLEAAMLRAGAFADVPSGESAALAYIKIGLGPQAFRLMPFRLRGGMSLSQAVDEIESRLQRHVEAFLIRDDLIMAARIRPRDAGGRKPRAGPYDHLARLDEWTLTAGVDDPE